MNSTTNFSDFTIHYRETIREAFKTEGLSKENFILVLDDDKNVIGIVTDGDFRRAVWNSISLVDPIDSITNKNFKFVSEDYTTEEVKNIFLTDVKQIPVLRNRKLINIIFKKEFDKISLKPSHPKLDIPVVIMAGGFGTRLDPFTRILPKPLIPIGEKPVIEIILNKFAEYGVTHFYISVNHKAKMIKSFFEDINTKFKIEYIEEEQPLGTAGALKFLEKKIRSSFIVSNCDIIIEEDYTKIIDFHVKNESSLTLVGSMQYHIIPYGVCSLKEGGELAKLIEKPKYDFLINTGMYIVNSAVLRFISQNERVDITELIERLKNHGEKVYVYPISEKSWIDIGQWDEYKKVIEKL